VNAVNGEVKFIVGVVLRAPHRGVESMPSFDVQDEPSIGESENLLSVIVSWRKRLVFRSFSLDRLTFRLRENLRRENRGDYRNR
jgi:hypothetical protein